MEDNSANEYINKVFGSIFQEYRLKNNLTQEKLSEELSKSTQTISRIETARDGTSKRTDIDLMNFLEIEPNVLYQNFITNPNLIKRIELSNKTRDLPIEKVEALFKIIDIIKGL